MRGHGLPTWAVSGPRTRTQFADASGIFLVADGMGGMTAEGWRPRQRWRYCRRCSSTAWRPSKRRPRPQSRQPYARGGGFQRRAYERSKRDPRLEGTGTTGPGLVVGRSAFIANLGDSRAYLFRAGLRQLTEDHHWPRSWPGWARSRLSRRPASRPQHAHALRGHGGEGGGGREAGPPQGPLPPAPVLGRPDRAAVRRTHLVRAEPGERPGRGVQASGG